MFNLSFASFLVIFGQRIPQIFVLFVLLW